MAVPGLPSPEIRPSSPNSAPEADGLVPRGCKRKRLMPITPPSDVDDEESQRTLDRAVHVLSTEATALTFVSNLYQTDPTARNGLLKAVETIQKANEVHGKLIICGVGKSAPTSLSRRRELPNN